VTPWAEKDLLLKEYHDNEWGVPERLTEALYDGVLESNAGD
jgi:3-methyladenine DNA glycosylase Tag